MTVPGETLPRVLALLPDWEAEEQADLSVPVIATPVLPAQRPWEAGSRLGDPRHTESPEASPRWEPHSAPSSQTAALTPAVSGQHRSGSRGSWPGAQQSTRPPPRLCPYNTPRKCQPRL